MLATLGSALISAYSAFLCEDLGPFSAVSFRRREHLTAEIGLRIPQRAAKEIETRTLFDTVEP